LQKLGASKKPVDQRRDPGNGEVEEQDCIQGMLDLDALVHAVEADQQNGHVGAVRKDDHELEGEAEAFVFARDRIGRRVGIHCNKRSQSWADGIEEGTDVTQNKAKLCRNLIISLVFERNANFLPKI
jgi:hypothetical protein